MKPKVDRDGKYVASSSVDLTCKEKITFDAGEHQP